MLIKQVWTSQNKQGEESGLLFLRRGDNGSRVGGQDVTFSCCGYREDGGMLTVTVASFEGFRK